jgi:diguanylate cyclase (GGDEF)-like protein
MLEHVSTRSRVLLLVIASALPLILLSIYSALEQRSAAEIRARAEIEHHAQLIAAVLDGSRIERLLRLEESALGRAEAVAIVERDGNVIARYPARETPAEDFGDRQFNERIAAAAGKPIERVDAAGISRLYAAQPATMTSAERPFAVFVVVSVPKSALHGDVNRALVQTLSGIVAVTLLLMLLAWKGAKRLVLSPIRHMLEVTAKVRAGDLTARTGMARSCEELSQLGAALDEMAEQLQTRDAKLREALEEVRTEAVTDVLTGLYNRRYFMDVLMREVLAARRTRRVSSVILLDLDHFKHVNDKWGHAAGDRVLENIGDMLRACVRGSDVAARYGGEEFALLLPEASPEIAAERAEDLRSSIASRENACGPAAVRITASFGIAQFDDATPDAATVMKQADDALYEAKAGGRNRVCVYKNVHSGQIPAHV